MAKKKQKLIIEDYLDFIDDRTLDLTVPQLSEIIGMHGFKKNQAQKRILMDIVSSMDLMDLRRSTLLDGGVSGDARLTLDEVIIDLNALDWQECHVTSILAQGATAVSASSASSITTVSAKRKKSKATARKKPVEVAVDRALTSTGGTTVAAGSSTERITWEAEAEAEEEVVAASGGEAFDLPKKEKEGKEA